MSSPDGPDEPARHSARKLEARRSSQRRRRRRAKGGLIALAVLAVAGGLFALVHSSGGHADKTAAQRATPPTPQERLLATRRREGWRIHPGPVPILMYHRLETATPGAYSELFVPVKLFHAQIRALHRHGFTAVTMEDVRRAWSGDGLLPRKPIVLSFDDGYRSQYTVAYRTLRRLRWPGQLYLVPSNTKIVSGSTVPEVKRMLAAGWELGAHTIHHRDLALMRGAQLTEEVTGSRKVLQRLFDAPVNSFCYPGGDYNNRTLKAVRRAGYTTATTVNPGLASRAKPLELNRIRVDGTDKPRVLLSTIAHFRSG